MEQSEQRALLAVPLVVLLAGFVAWAGGQGSYQVIGIPIIGVCFALAFVIQWAAFAVAFIRQTEKFYDLVGGITYLSVTWLAILLCPARDVRSWLLVAIVSIWAIRLSTFLFRRVRAAGEDRRFRDIKPSFARFLIAWTLQGLWVSLTLAAALAAMTTMTRKEPGVFLLAGALLWLLGFGIEVIADRQKSNFRAQPGNKDQFINTGLWAWSRHPNYFGEIVLWIGVAVIAVPVLTGWQWVTLISPIFVYILLTRISGLPMLEAYADEKWGGQPEYEDYKSRTPVLIIKPPERKG